MSHLVNGMEALSMIMERRKCSFEEAVALLEWAVQTGRVGAYLCDGDGLTKIRPSVQ